MEKSTERLKSRRRVRAIRDALRAVVTDDRLWELFCFFTQPLAHRSAVTRQRTRRLLTAAQAPIIRRLAPKKGGKKRELSNRPE
jgi:hypothetical protein